MLLDLDTTAWVAGIPNSEFTSPRGLGELLAQTPQCQECVVKQVFRYMAGREDTPADRPVIRRALDRFRDSGFRFKELMVSLSYRTGNSIRQEGCRWLTSLASATVCLAGRSFAG